MSNTKQVIRNLVLFLFCLLLAMGFSTNQVLAKENTGDAYGNNVAYQEAFLVDNVF